jgi:predicted peroxiredoxin
MADYLLIESRDPFEVASVTSFLRIALDLKKAGNTVTLFLVQNGVLPTRKGVRADDLAQLTASGISVLADEFSLKERAIGKNDLAGGVKSAPIDIVIDKLASGSKAIWH